MAAKGQAWKGFGPEPPSLTACSNRYHASNSVTCSNAPTKEPEVEDQRALPNTRTKQLAGMTRAVITNKGEDGSALVVSSQGKWVVGNAAKEKEK